MASPPRHLVPTPRAHASLRRVALLDGPEAGLEALALSTGGGLDAWLLPGRTLDIGPLWWRGRQLAWMPPGGLLHPAFRRAEEEAGRGFERLFGGFLVTCGLSHIRAPEGGEPLHGRLPFTPARLTLAHDDRVLEAEAECWETRINGPSFRLRRRIEAEPGGGALRLTDEVENFGPEPAPHAMLYHVNLGWPLLAPGTLVWCGADLLGALDPGRPGPRAPAICRAAPSGEARVTSPEGVALTLRWDAAAMPFLQTWHDLRPRVAVLSLEPCTTDLGAPAPLLAPGERRSYALEIMPEDAR